MLRQSITKPTREKEMWCSHQFCLFMLTWHWLLCFECMGLLKGKFEQHRGVRDKCIVYRGNNYIRLV